MSSQRPNVRRPILKLAVQFASTQHRTRLPKPLLRTWVKAACVDTELWQSIELTLRFVDLEEGRVLNRNYRGKDYATNVLTFAYEPVLEGVLLTDIVFCDAVVEQEAAAQGKELLAHYAHLVIHGVLHAQGYDHERESDAKKMEALETALLAKLGYPDPCIPKKKMK